MAHDSSNVWKIGTWDLAVSYHGVFSKISSEVHGRWFDVWAAAPYLPRGRQTSAVPLIRWVGTNQFQCANNGDPTADRGRTCWHRDGRQCIFLAITSSKNVENIRMLKWTVKWLRKWSWWSEVRRTYEMMRAVDKPPGLGLWLWLWCLWCSLQDSRHTQSVPMDAQHTGDILFILLGFRWTPVFVNACCFEFICVLHL